MNDDSPGLANLKAKCQKIEWVGADEMDDDALKRQED